MLLRTPVLSCARMHRLCFLWGDAQVVFPLGESTALHIEVSWNILLEPECCIRTAPPHAHKAGQQYRQYIYFC